MAKRTILILLFLFTGMLAQAHTWMSAQAQGVSEGTTFDRGRVFTLDGSVVPFEWLKFGRENLLYETGRGRGALSLETSNVFRVEVQKGTYALEFAGGGGAVGLLASLLSVKQAEDSASTIEGTEVSSGLKTGLVVGITGVMVIVGALIGAGKKKYATVYTNPRYAAGGR